MLSKDFAVANFRRYSRFLIDNLAIADLESVDERVSAEIVLRDYKQRSAKSIPILASRNAARFELANFLNDSHLYLRYSPMEIRRITYILQNFTAHKN